MTRSRTIFKVIGLSTVLWSLQVAAAAKLSDSEIRQHMIGSWIIPTNSSDYQPMMAKVVETYYADGSETLLFFLDRDCKTVFQTLKAKWSVTGGVLITTTPDGQADRDDILDITGQKMTLHSQRDGTNYTRVRATNCGNIGI
jgi:hypothetical protein